MIMGYFEAFHNFDDQVVERFFTLYKFKLGLIYRINYRWRIDLGAIHQNTKNNVVEPVQIPTNIITNYILDWGIAYLIPPKENMDK